MPDSFPLSYRVQWERSRSQALCQAGIVCIGLGPDEYVGFCAGYLGEGEFVNEPFHVRLNGEVATLLVIGDRSVLNGKASHFETWPKNVREQVMRARRHLMSLMTRDEEGFLQASAAEFARITWSQNDEGSSGAGDLDERVWLRVPVQLGLSG